MGGKETTKGSGVEGQKQKEQKVSEAREAEHQEGEAPRSPHHKEATVWTPQKAWALGTASGVRKARWEHRTPWDHDTHQVAGLPHRRAA